MAFSARFTYLVLCADIAAKAKFVRERLVEVEKCVRSNREVEPIFEKLNRSHLTTSNGTRGAGPALNSYADYNGDAPGCCASIAAMLTWLFVKPKHD